MAVDFSSQVYVPILAIKPGEMAALEQLPDKDKDLLLPLFPIRGWSSAHKLSNALLKIYKCIENRPWIADIDESFLTGNKTFLFTGEHPGTPVYQELKDLLKPDEGYENWFNFLVEHKSAIPCLQCGDIDNLRLQIHRLSSLQRGLVLRICADDSYADKHDAIIRTLAENTEEQILIIYDLGSIDHNYEERVPLLSAFMMEARKMLPKAVIAISASSFPTSFSGMQKGESSIYERILFNKLNDSAIFGPLIYSDRGSARAQKQDGGGGTPPPRIDYPLKKDWRFVRREVEDNIPNSKALRKAAYIEIANEIVKSGYWIPELRLWGTQQIELTAEGNDFAIYTAQRSTAARINIHLYTQLHYNEKYEEISTDEEWVD